MGRHSKGFQHSSHAQTFQAFGWERIFESESPENGKNSASTFLTFEKPWINHGYIENPRNSGVLKTPTYKENGGKTLKQGKNPESGSTAL